MAKGNEIIVSNEPRGRFLEGTISGTPKPGTCMEIVPNTAAVQGRFTYRVYQPGTDGERRAVIVLLPDFLQGKTALDAYVSGDRCFMYMPLPGDELNMLIADVAGTGTAEHRKIGDLFMIDTGTGKLIKTTGSPESEPFVLLEELADPISADWLGWCLFTGY